MLTKRNKVERMTIVNTLLTSIYEELLKGEADDIDGLLQIAVYAQVEMNRIVFDLNQRNGCEPQTDVPRCSINGTPFDECGFCEHFNCDTCHCEADTPQTDCDTCKHYKPACELFSEICKYEPTTQTETENSNLTFEKVMEEIQTQVIEFPDTHQKFTFARKIEMDGDSIKIGGWEYKGVKDAERFVKGSEQTERSE